MKITTISFSLVLLTLVAGCSSGEMVSTSANDDDDVSTGKVYSDPKADIGNKEHGARGARGSGRRR